MAAAFRDTEEMFSGYYNGFARFLVFTFRLPVTVCLSEW